MNTALFKETVRLLRKSIADEHSGYAVSKISTVKEERIGYLFTVDIQEYEHKIEVFVGRRKTTEDGSTSVNQDRIEVVWYKNNGDRRRSFFSVKKKDGTFDVDKTLSRVQREAIGETLLEIEYKERKAKFEEASSSMHDFLFENYSEVKTLLSVVQDKDTPDVWTVTLRKVDRKNLTRLLKGVKKLGLLEE